MTDTTLYRHPEFPQYLIAPNGQVFSLRSGRFLKPQRMGEYTGLMITHASGVIVKRYIHRLVLEAVVGPCPEGMEARHLNGNRHDNRSTNLTWGTKSQNECDKAKHGTAPRGTHNGMAKLTWRQVREIRALSRTGTIQRRIAAQFGVSLMTVNRVIRGESWQESPR
jgi:hypothetical protein